MEISDKPGQDEAEPAFKVNVLSFQFIGNVHGDEPVGRELLFHLANWICGNYMKDPLATLIVDNIHLHMLPSMNPDGFALRRRGNANNIDLNRDFPDQLRKFTSDHWFMAFEHARSFVYFEGSACRKLSMDGTEDRKYPIYGGMQDWNYIHHGCFELTLEISDNKWPNATELPTLWEYNRMSMLNLVANLVKTGIHGRIFSADNGRPLPASVVVRGINYTVKAGKLFADYHRLLAPREKCEGNRFIDGSETLW
ncbi:UNVERIFIED_CONTAM: Carboxypeptidase SOL1 [Sesamum calycinum]|uniref:Carboxypeptidase SOL1 n=1 Tax=Sesamum calycinum TaxID=2727403 RepID=A0AAW2PD54_9LAMI